jgi:hypothetical protein
MLYSFRSSHGRSGSAPEQAKDLLGLCFKEHVKEPSFHDLRDVEEMDYLRDVRKPGVDAGKSVLGTEEQVLVQHVALRVRVQRHDGDVRFNEVLEEVSPIGDLGV